jgi:hypothetical protein
MSFTLRVAGYEIPCVVLTDHVKAPDLTVTVSTDADESMVQRVIHQEATKRFWALQGDIPLEHINQQFSFRTNSGHVVQLYSFAPWPLSADIQTEISEAIGTFASRLRMPTLIRRLSSIQIRTTNLPNPKSGGLMHGREFPQQSRFELFSSAFTSGRYRDDLVCSWLTGTLIHEMAHLCLEEDLAPFWRDAASQLGWFAVDPDTNVILPGGDVTRIVNLCPSRCPTSYAALQPDDDRAESVVAAMMDALEDPLRNHFVSSVLTDDVHCETCTVQEVEPHLPIPKSLRVLVHRDSDDAFGEISTRVTNVAVRMVQLDEYLRRHGVR